MVSSSIHIEEDEQLSFNKAYSLLKKYFVYSVESNQRIDYTFQVNLSNGDLGLSDAIKYFFSYAKLYKTSGEYVCEIEHLDFGIDKYIFYIPKDSKLYKLICNYENQFNKDDSKSYSDISNDMFNKLFDNSINPTATTGDLKVKEYIETLLDNAIKFILSDGDDKDRTYTESELNIIKNCAKNALNPIPLKGYGKFPNLSPKSKFKAGDKVKIIKDYIMDIKGESVNFKGFEGFINDVIFNSFIFEYDYTIAVNGITTSKINESTLELIEQPKKIEYRKDLYDIADDIDGCLLPDFQPKTELIQRKIS